MTFHRILENILVLAISYWKGHRPDYTKSLFDELSIYLRASLKTSRQLFVHFRNMLNRPFEINTHKRNNFNYNYTSFKNLKFLTYVKPTIFLFWLREFKYFKSIHMLYLAVVTIFPTRFATDPPKAFCHAGSRYMSWSTERTNLLLCGIKYHKGEFNLCIYLWYT
jgi:hypothetical protein